MAFNRPFHLLLFPLVLSTGVGEWKCNRSASGIGYCNLLNDETGLFVRELPSDYTQQVG